MPIHTLRNQYQGVNAHLQSHFQAFGDWSGFHNSFVIYLAHAINDILPKGYVVDIEKSLQIREVHPDTGEKIRIHNPKPDLALYAETPAKQPTFGSTTLEASLTVAIPETITLSDDLFLTAVVIYERAEDAILGKPITQIELLSKTNKPPGEGFIQYHDKRIACLKSGLALVEIDFLHESDSPIGRIPSYRRNEANATPYYIAISIPYPDFTEGQTNIYGFGVDNPIPTLDLPLSGQETVTVEFNAVYNTTFESIRAYSLRVDYEQLPENFDRYAQADQDRIRHRLQAIMQAHQQQIDLEANAPLPLEEAT